jgi:hypothetical protein
MGHFNGSAAASRGLPICPELTYEPSGNTETDDVPIG